MGCFFFNQVLDVKGENLHTVSSPQWANVKDCTEIKKKKLQKFDIEQATA